MKVVTRFAPSPTGYLHIGGLRTALYNYLFAKQNKGKMILRIEDTDRERYVDGAVEKLLVTLKTVGLNFDEGPYVQSERTEIYREHADILLQTGAAYRCFCSRERLDEIRQKNETNGQHTKYDRFCLKFSAEETTENLSASIPFCIRLKIPEGRTEFNDAIRGRIAIENEQVDDQVLIKSDGFPTYHLANVVDDHLMKVTHVIRGEEWLSSVPKHIILYQAFGWEMPIFAHLPLILNADHSKMSKRQGDVAVEDYLEKGFLPEALLNYVALLGFNPKADQEIYTLDELIKLFDLSKINKSGAVFSVDKLKWLNGMYIRKKTPEELCQAVQPFLDKVKMKVPVAIMVKICQVEQERMELLSEVVGKSAAFLTMPHYDTKILIWKKADVKDAKVQLDGVGKFISNLSVNDFSSLQLLETSIKRYIEENKLNNGNVLWPLRVSLSGQVASPSPFEMIWVLGKKETVRRIKIAITNLEIIS